jgi:hypothetical protein
MEDDLVDVARFQGDAEYVLKLVRKAVRKAACGNDVQQIHDLSRAIKALPVMAGFNLRPIGRLALVDAVEIDNQAAVHAIVTGFDLTAADVRSVKESIGDPDLTDCLDCELILLEGTVDEDKIYLDGLYIWLCLVLVWLVCAPWCASMVGVSKDTV